MFFLTPKPKYILLKMWLLSDSVRLLILGLPKPKIMETYGKAYNSIPDFNDVPSVSDRFVSSNFPKVSWLVVWNEMYPVMPTYGTLYQWEFQGPKMAVLYCIKPYLGGIFPYPLHRPCT